MKPFLQNFPYSQKFLSSINQCADTFLYDRLYKTEYGFWSHLEFFLKNIDRFKNYNSIFKRLSIIVPMEMKDKRAWEEWRKFRSAQAEVTVIYLIENYFLANVLEIINPERIPTPDIRVNLNDIEYTIEIKAQSGQQHGSKHPRAKGDQFFSPQDEKDLKSWLFEEKISSRNGKQMKPKIIEADDKNADILVAMTDHFEEIECMGEQASLISPGSQFIDTKAIVMEKYKPLVAHFFKSTFPTQNVKVKEIWLFNESRLDRFMILSKESILLSHLMNKTC